MISEKIRMQTLYIYSNIMCEKVVLKNLFFPLPEHYYTKVQFYVYNIVLNRITAICILGKLKTFLSKYT